MSTIVKINVFSVLAQSAGKDLKLCVLELDCIGKKKIRRRISLQLKEWMGISNARPNLYLVTDIKNRKKIEDLCIPSSHHCALQAGKKSAGHFIHNRLEDRSEPGI